MKVYSGFKGLVEKTENSINKQFLRNYLKILPQAYSLAYHSCYEKLGISPYQARDLFPHMRRAILDDLLIKLSAQYTELKVSTYKNDAKNCSYVRVQSGDVILTANAVTTPLEMVRPALFRVTLARDNRQLELFSKIGTDNYGDFYYANLLHGPDEINLEKVSFAYLAYPSSDFKYYITSINLEKHFGISMYETIVNIEEIEDTVFASFKKTTADKKEEE